MKPQFLILTSYVCDDLYLFKHPLSEGSRSRFLMAFPFGKGGFLLLKTSIFIPDDHGKACRFAASAIKAVRIVTSENC